MLTGGKRRGRRILIGCVAVLGVFVVGAAAALYGISEHLTNNVQRIPNVFAPLPESSRPAVPTYATGTETFLLVGSDSRADAPTTGSRAADATNAADSADATSPIGQRSDVMMLVRLAADRESAVVISIPRDSWVNVPGRGMAKINASYAWGGPTLAVRTVEALTGIRIDHFAAIDFAGFKAMTDAVGGIDVRVAETTTSRGITFHQGTNHLDGAQALAYVRQRYGLARGDLDRVQRQQNVLRAILTKAASGGMLTHPVGLYRLLSAVTESVSVDDTMSNGDLRSLALSLHNLRGSNVTFMTAPVSGFGWEGKQSVVYLDACNSGTLWSAVRHGTVDRFLRTYRCDTLPRAPV